MVRTLAFLGMIAAVSGCKVSQATAQVKDDATLPGKFGPTTLVCTQTAVHGAAGTSDAALAPLAAMTGLTITVPARFDGMTSADIKDPATIQMTGGTNPPLMAQALDLYDRAGTLAQVSGAIAGAAPDYTPQFTAKIDLNTHANNQSGFATLALYQGGQTIGGTLQLTCVWQPTATN